MEDLPRSARATRGKRLTKLLDEEADADNSFWSQDAFKEERNDNEYEEEEEQVDEFDSDFDQEEAPESEGEKDEKEVVKKKRKLPYKKPTSSDKKKKSVSFLLKSTDKPKPTTTTTTKKKAAPPREQEEGDGGEGERVVRKSTRVSVVAKQAERAAKAAQTTPRPVKKRKEEERRMTQEDMLLEAAQTEVINLQSLERMLAREEEVKKKAIIQKSVYVGPQVRFISKNGINILEFTKVSTLPSAINSKAKPYPERAICVVTGLPAKYKDPKTGQSYATKEAFRIIRERFARSSGGTAGTGTGGSGEKSSSTRRDSLEEIHQRKRTKVEAERAASSRAGVVKLKFKKSPGGRDAAAASSSPQGHHHQQHQHQHQQQQQKANAVVPAASPPPPPIDFHTVIDDADFMLEGLDDLKPDYKIEDSILYETSEKLEAQFTSEFPWHH